MMKAGLYLLGIGLILGVLGTGCKTRKINNQLVIDVDSIQNTTFTAQDISFPEKNLNWFDGKFDAQVDNDGKVNSLKGRVRMRKDSLIWISIKPDVAIIEVFRILISPDSVKLINYLDKEYFKGDFEFIKNQLQVNINFKAIQSIFLGEPYFMLPREQYKALKIGTDDVYSSDDLALYTQQRAQGLNVQMLFQAIWCTTQKQVWRNVLYDPANKVELDLQYTAFTTVDSIVFPQKAAMAIQSDKPPVKFFFDYTKIELNTPFTFPFSIPDSYKPMSLKTPAK